MSETPTQQPKFLDRLRAVLHMRGHPQERATAYVSWTASLIRFHALRHPETMGEAEVGAFLTHLACDTTESLPRQAQARQALVFLYREFLHRDLGPIPVTWVRAHSADKVQVHPVRPPLLEQMRLANGGGWISLPDALAQK